MKVNAVAHADGVVSLVFDEEANEALETAAAALGMKWEAVIEHALWMYLSDGEETKGEVAHGTS